MSYYRDSTDFFFNSFFLRCRIGKKNVSCSILLVFVCCWFLVYLFFFLVIYESPVQNINSIKDQVEEVHFVFFIV